jgi:hypothetical protein
LSLSEQGNSGLIDRLSHSGAAVGGLDGTLVMNDQNIWASGPRDRIALIVFFIGVTLLAAGVALWLVMYFA